MTEEQLYKYRDEATCYIKALRLRDAIRVLRAMVPQQAWRIVNKIDKAEEAYVLMLKYATDGVTDPQRAAVYADIVAQLYSLLDNIVRETLTADSATLYFNVVRYEKMQLETLPQLMANYKRLNDDTSLFHMAMAGTTARGSNDSLSDKENAERRIFNKTWTEYPLLADSVDALTQMFADDAVPMYFKEYMVSAVLLGGLAYYEESRLQILLDVYASAPRQLALKALSAFVLIVYVHRNRPVSKHVSNVVAALREHPQWGRDIRAIFMQLIRTRETEKITRKVQDEIMPQMMKLGPELYKNMEDTSAVIDLSEMEENPEWQERLESSGIADKMKELSQLQEDGGDIMMSTFSHLKAYPFFNELPNWFMPFHVDHTVVINSIGHNSTIGELISTTPFLCNSDKFSFALSMAQVPDEQRKIMMAQIDEQNINIADLDNASLAPDDKRNENVINKYIQDLYRFYKLFRRKGEFLDPFLYPINLTQVPVLSQDMADFDTLQLVGEFYFSRGYYSDAIELFSRLSELLPPDAAIYQKIGYCYQRIGNIEAALQKYEQAELLNADSIWLMKRMAACYKHQCNVQKALDYFRRIETKRSDDLSVVLNIGHCLCELGQYQEAIRYYYKVEFLDATSNRAWRPLAWCALLCRDFETSRKYYEKILAGTPTADDFLNAGHLKLAMGDIRDAMAQYRQSADMYANKMEDLIDNINRDKQQLSEIGVDITLLPLIVDSILYISDSY